MTKYAESFYGCFPFSDMAVSFALNAATALSYTIPGGSQTQYRLEFSIPYNANIWVGYNVTPTVPSANTIAQTQQVERINNTLHVRYVRGGDVLTFISDSIVTNAGFSLLTTTM